MDEAALLLGTYQRRVKELAAANRLLEETLAEERRAHRAESLRLTLESKAGLTEETQALRRAVSRWRDRALAAEGRLTEQLRRR